MEIEESHPKYQYAAHVTFISYRGQQIPWSIIFAEIGNTPHKHVIHLSTNGLQFTHEDILININVKNFPRYHFTEFCFCLEKIDKFVKYYYKQVLKKDERDVVIGAVDRCTEEYLRKILPGVEDIYFTDGTNFFTWEENIPEKCSENDTRQVDIISDLAKALEVNLPDSMLVKPAPDDLAKFLESVGIKRDSPEYRAIRLHDYPDIYGVVTIQFKKNRLSYLLEPIKFFVTTNQKYTSVTDCEKNWLFKLRSFIDKLGITKLYVVGDKAYSLLSTSLIMNKVRMKRRMQNNLKKTCPDCNFQNCMIRIAYENLINVEKQKIDCIPILYPLRHLEVPDKQINKLRLVLSKQHICVI
jgi:hypothetical protein